MTFTKDGGDTGNNFMIDSSTGQIRTNNLVVVVCRFVHRLPSASGHLTPAAMFENRNLFVSSLWSRIMRRQYTTGQSFNCG